MDIVHFNLNEHVDPWKRTAVALIDITINGTPLPTLIAEVERPFAEQEGNPSIAGEYLGLEPDLDVQSARTHFMGAQGSNLLCEPSDHTALLRCGDCGGVGCWPLMVRVIVLERFVIWSDFVQPQRADKWSYDGVSFTFGRPEYEDALRRLDDELAAVKAARRTPSPSDIRKRDTGDPLNQ